MDRILPTPVETPGPKYPMNYCVAIITNHYKSGRIFVDEGGFLIQPVWEKHIKVLIQVADSCSSQRRWLPFLWASHHPGEKGNRRELTGLHLVEIDAISAPWNTCSLVYTVISRKPVLEAQLQEWKAFRDFCLSALTHVHLEKTNLPESPPKSQNCKKKNRHLYN